MRASQPIILENSAVRLEISPDSSLRALIDRMTGKDYNAGDPLIPMMQLTAPGVSVSVVTCRREGRSFRAQFAPAGITALFDLTLFPEYFHWKLTELTPSSGVASIQVFRALLKLTENCGEILNVAWNPEFAVCALAISRGVRAEFRRNAYAGPALNLYRETGLVGSEWAIVACPRSRLEQVIGQVADRHGLPNPKIDGLRAKDAPFNQRSYFFTDMTEANHAVILEACRTAGMRLVLPNIYPQFYGRVGHYHLRADTYPGGESAYAGIVGKFRDAGIGVGMHAYLPLVDHLDPYACPQLHPDLVRANAFVLARDLGERDDQVVTERPPLGMMQGGSLLIDEERVDFGWVNWQLPCGFGGAQRGSYGTRAAGHKAGTLVYLLGTHAGCLQVSMQGQVVERIAARVAEFVNRFGLDMIYFDGNEGPVKLAQSHTPTHWYDRLAWLERICANLDRPDVVIESSDVQHRDWHLNTRGTCGDPDPTQPQAQDPLYKRRQPQFVGYADQLANLLPPTLGWSLLHGRGPGLRGLWDGVAPTTAQDIRAHLEVARQLDCPVSFEVTQQDLATNPELPRIFALLNAYESERLRRHGFL